jgi:hypothetical protein
MNLEPVIQEMLQCACPSIQYRIRVEILGQSPAGEGMAALQEAILKDPTVRDVLSWQQPDGWLAWDFHDSKSLETGIHILCEKGVDPHQLQLSRALQALENHPERLERGIGQPGKILDELGFGGRQMIRAAVFAYAGLEDKPCVREQIEQALAGFKSVLEGNSIEEITEDYKGRLVFKPGVRWPGIYHLRLLAFTRKWRTEENQAMLVRAIQRLVDLSPLPNIYVRGRSGWVAPASFGMHDFNPAMESMDDAEWMMWFHRMECLGRLGVIAAISELKHQVDRLENSLERQGGWFTRKLNHPYFNRWGTYTGLRLEADWRHAKSRVYDLTFRSMLILHYYGS